jgi:DNA-directed RNA polymerase subunit omega
MDIVSLPIDIKRETIDSRFRLVIVAAQRARQIMEGAKPMIATRPSQKESTLAIEEILSGELDILYGADAVSAHRDERRRREELRRQAMLAEREEQGAGDVKADLSIYLGEAMKQVEMPETSPPKATNETK